MKISGKHGGYEVGDNHPPLITGVINLSPESFYKGSIEFENAGIEPKILDMINCGVAIIDVGALSSRPITVYGGEVPTMEQELSRIKEGLPIIINIASKYNIPISIDTQSSIVAGEAIKMGCTIVNDISGFKEDDNMASVVAKYNVDAVIMATKEKPGDVCGLDEIIESLKESIDIAIKAGIQRNKLVIDPAFGGWAGKSKNCDLELIKELNKLRELELPIYVGVSRKSTIKTLDGGDLPEDRLIGSIIMTQWLVEKGCHIIRTHDVKETNLALKVARKIKSLID